MANHVVGFVILAVVLQSYFETIFLSDIFNAYWLIILLKCLIFRSKGPLPAAMHAGPSEHYKYNEFMRFMNRVSDGDVNIENSQQPIGAWTDEFAETSEADVIAAAATATTSDQENDWVNDFAEHKAKQGDAYILHEFFILALVSACSNLRRAPFI